MSLLTRLHQAIDSAAIAKWRSLVARIERRGENVKNLTNQELRKQSLALRFEVLSGKPLDEMVVEGAILVREAAERAIGLRHYRVQLLGGIAMHFGSIAVMQTGEGKTLTATVPLYLAAVTGRGAHLATANDYLAARDAEQMRPVFDLLGLSVGVVKTDSSRCERMAAYAADVTYSTAKEIGFDFLRDRLLLRNAQQSQTTLIRNLIGESNSAAMDRAVQRAPNFILVDEADSILIDEARTPLIVSSIPDEVALARKELYRWSSSVVSNFEQERDYEVDPKTRQVTLNEAGRKLARKLPKPPTLNRTPMLDFYEQLELAIHVDLYYTRDRQFVIRNGEIVIVDEFTGRLAEGRKWKSGLHQAIEAREGVDISIETGEAARITIQDLFLRYPRLAGMTGTAANSAKELRTIYRTKVIDVPTNHPPKRVQLRDMVFGTESEKWKAIVDEIEDLHRTGRPVLVGTRSIDKSERLSRMLTERSIEHDVLNARQLDREAQIIASAGQVSRVTVATNMAGRGTDIKVSSAALDLGGLHVICSELHESARIDRQLIGRCGRQGDPGSYRRTMSLEDELLAQGLGAERAKSLHRFAGESPSQLSCFATLFFTAQRNVERRHFNARKMLLYQEKQRHEVQREMGLNPYLDAVGI